MSRRNTADRAREDVEHVEILEPAILGRPVRMHLNIMATYLNMDTMHWCGMVKVQIWTCTLCIWSMARWARKRRQDGPTCEFMAYNMVHGCECMKIQCGCVLLIVYIQRPGLARKNSLSLWPRCVFRHMKIGNCLLRWFG